ncbi:MAG: 16S rRNA (uracil(1498)-N(3))-methyltransferase [Pseudomonadales bacterium]|nr:16S rRNA (uracil(1498)-N(3))-methyltransferase [Cellvibrionales bacterium]MBP8030425.1 16S rRNA (uracil(1498)-N(3))-methyltransferase [Pseudomonadales bacterium]
MNIIPLTDMDFTSPGHCVLRDARARHIVHILKSSMGDTLRAGRINGMLGSATVTAISSAGDVELAVQLDEAPPTPHPVTLLLALPRPKMLGRLLRDVTSLGVKNIHLFHSDKVEKSYWQTPSLAPAYVHDKLVEGLAQARDTQLPVIHQHRRFQDIVSHILPGLLRTHTGVLADPFSHGADVTASGQPLALVIGPEGGFTDSERQQLLDTGCQPLWLGSRILRVETAVHVAMGHLGRIAGLP